MRVRRKSIGGMSETSAAVQTATTPGNASAAAVSIDAIRPCACAERTTRMCSMRGKTTSAANLPWPVTSGGSSSRGTDRPTTPMSGLAPGIRFLVCACPYRKTGSHFSGTCAAQRRADALRRRRELVDRRAERRERVVDGVDYGDRRADRAALAQTLGPGDRGLRPCLAVMDLDRRNLARGRRQVVRETRGEDVAALVVDDLLEQCVGDALGDAAVNLAVDDHGIDQPSGILGHQEFLDHDAAGL